MRHGLLLVALVAALVAAQTKLVWEHTTDNGVTSTVVAANGAVFAGTDDGQFISLNQSTGYRVIEDLNTRVQQLPTEVAKKKRKGKQKCNEYIIVTEHGC